MTELRAGTAREDITPPPGIRLSGYAGRTGPNIGCRDPLYAAALFVTDGFMEAVILTLDVIGLTADMDAHLRTLIGDRLNIAADAVLVACSHTHSGPATMPLRATGAMEMLWTETILERAARAAVAAKARAAAVTARHDSGQSDANINRRQAAGRNIAIGHNPHGPCDPRCRLLLLESDSGPLAAVVHYAMHPVVLGSDNLRVSADWVSAMRIRVEQALGCPVLFLQGCCGDINPRTRGTDAICDSVGADVAGAALTARANLRSMDSPRLGIGAAEAKIPVLPLLPDAELTKIEQAARATLADPQSSLGQRHIAEADLDWSDACRALRQSGDAVNYVPGRVSALNIGDIVLVGLPGEIFHDIGADIQAAMPNVWPVGYANGNLGYLYPDQAYREGGYEVEVAYRLYGERQAGPGTAHALAEAAWEATTPLGTRG